MKSMSEVDLKSKYHERSFFPAILLFFLAPFFGEYLLGNLTLSELPESGPKVFIDYIGSGIFACVAIILFIIAVRKLQLSETN